MTRIIDRRLNAKNKSTVNRQRFISRYKKHLKQSVADAISKRSIVDVEKGENISIPSKDVAESRIGHGSGGVREGVFPGNTEFQEGDRIPRPNQQAGAGANNQASNQGEGEDEFAFQLSREEFLELYFDDLELPNLIRKQLAEMTNSKYKRAGVSTTGVPNNINIIRSMKQALARRKAMSAPIKQQIHEVESRIEHLTTELPDHAKEVLDAQEKLAALQVRLKRVPFIDDFDIRYNNRVKMPAPSTNAVMFCIMDVSGSMDEMKKDIAKRFFVLLYLFLTKMYDKIELVFIRHHTSAKEVDEEEFFYSRETGGTVVSSALGCLRDIIHKKYPKEDWNIYVAQASDGDNWNADSPYCQQILAEQIMPFVQYFAYIEIMPRHHQSLWESYLRVRENHPNFVMQNIDNRSEIYPVFRELFKRQNV